MFGTLIENILLTTCIDANDGPHAMIVWFELHLGSPTKIENGQIVCSSLEISREATNFLQVHGSEDSGHLNAPALAIEWYVRDCDHMSDICYATKMTYRNYGHLFTDVMELGDFWSKRTV